MRYRFLSHETGETVEVGVEDLIHSGAPIEPESGDDMEYLGPTFEATERGNNVILRDDNDGFAAWIHVEGDWWLEIVYDIHSYPALRVRMAEYARDQLALHVREELCGHHVLKCNLDGVAIDEDGRVSPDPTHEQETGMITIRYYDRNTHSRQAIELETDSLAIDIPAQQVGCEDEQPPLTVNVNTDAVRVDQGRKMAALYEYAEMLDSDGEGVNEGEFQ